uniref:CSON010040 protein n=1 Tax=Culicoides sonorensis TaxID=179676 RepID=A0A336LHI0_CULSO
MFKSPRQELEEIDQIPNRSLYVKWESFKVVHRNKEQKSKIKGDVIR